MKNISLDKNISLELKEFFENALEDTEISYIETSSLEFKKRIQGTKLHHLKPWFTNLKEEADRFDINRIKRLLKESLETIKSREKKKSS